jgi:hypothetical protein
MARQAQTHDSQHDANGVHVEALEQRVGRLEDAVAAIQDTHLMEDRVVERVVQRIEQVPLPPPSTGSGVFATAARMLLPKTVDAVPDDPAAPAADGTKSPWLIVEVLNELRWMLRMLTDYRYRMTWTGRTVLVVAIIVVVLSWFMLSGLPFVGGLLDRAVLIVAVIATYKAMSRELVRYRDLMSRLWRYR